MIAPPTEQPKSPMMIASHESHPFEPLLKSLLCRYFSLEQEMTVDHAVKCVLDHAARHDDKDNFPSMGLAAFLESFSRPRLEATARAFGLAGSEAQAGERSALTAFIVAVSVDVEYHAPSSKPADVADLKVVSFAARPVSDDKPKRDKKPKKEKSETPVKKNEEGEAEVIIIADEPLVKANHEKSGLSIESKPKKEKKEKKVSTVAAIEGSSYPHPTSAKNVEEGETEVVDVADATLAEPLVKAKHEKSGPSIENKPKKEKKEKKEKVSTVAAIEGEVVVVADEPPAIFLNSLKQVHWQEEIVKVLYDHTNTKIAEAKSPPPKKEKRLSDTPKEPKPKREKKEAKAVVVPVCSIPVGTLVEATWKGGEYIFRGTITTINTDGTVAIRFDDGEVEPHADASTFRVHDLSRLIAEGGWGLPLVALEGIPENIMFTLLTRPNRLPLATLAQYRVPIGPHTNSFQLNQWYTVADLEGWCRTNQIVMGSDRKKSRLVALVMRNLRPHERHSGSPKESPKEQDSSPGTPPLPPPPLEELEAFSPPSPALSIPSSFASATELV